MQHGCADGELCPEEAQPVPWPGESQMAGWHGDPLLPVRETPSWDLSSSQREFSLYLYPCLGCVSPEQFTC